MAEGELTSEERQVLGVLMQSDRGITDLTVDGIAETLGMESQVVARVLDQLEAEGVVHCDQDATLDVKFWIALNGAAELLDPLAAD